METLVKKFLIIPLLSLSLSAIAQAQPVTCKNGAQEYSAGATICECPSLKGDGRLASGGRSQIIGRRLMCDKSGEWKSADSLCLDIVSSGGVAAEDYPKYYELYCPRAVVGKSAEQTEQLFTPNIQILSTMSRMCRRLPALVGPCKALIFAIAVTVQ